MVGPDELIVEVLGIDVAVRAPESVLVELRRVLVDLAPGNDPSRRLEIAPEADGGFRLLDSGAVAHTGIAREVVAATVVWRLNAIAATTMRHVVVHAGCVAGAGAVLLPGRSGAGKSTLVAACVTAGSSYLSDEYAALDMTSGRLAPYAKPIGFANEQLVASSQLRTSSVAPSLPPAGIVFPRYERGAATSITRLDPGWTLLALAAHTTNLVALGGTALAWLAGLAALCPAWQITYSDAGDVLPFVTGATEPTVDVCPAEEIGPITPTTTTVVLDDGLAVHDMSTGQVHVLSVTASFVWTCVPDAADLSRLADVAIARASAGSLDPARAAAAVGQLEQCGLLSGS